jgi:hypothetical protein
MEAWVASHAPKLRRSNVDVLGESYPFHQLIFSPDDLVIVTAERSIVTSMGAQLYPRIAVALAQDRFQDVVTQHTIEGEINETAANMIEQIVTELRSPGRGRRNRRTPNQPIELDLILNHQEGESVQRSVIADLYIGDFDGGPLFVELKTPRPNLDIAAESKRKMLYYLTLMDRRNVSGAKAFLGLTYNPYITRADYDHTPTSQIMDMESEVLIGSEFWDYIGGDGTYDELLEIVAEINPSAT